LIFYYKRKGKKARTAEWTKRKLKNNGRLSEKKEKQKQKKNEKAQKRKNI